MKVAVNTPLFDGNEKKYLMDCIDTGWISSSGEYINRFEEEFANFLGVKYGVAVSNGTTALETAIQALNLEKGSEIIMPDFTIISCVQAVIKAGLVPVFVDCDRTTWNMDVGQIEKNITNKTKGIMAVHIYGLPVDMDPIIDLSRKYNLVIIEDVAEAQGLLYKNKQCGSLGDISAFSFFANKHITCGEGGMVTTSNDFYYSRSKKIRNLFFDEERRYIHEEFGDNFRMTNMQAAIGLAQLEKINRTVKRKREIGNKYLQELSKVDFFQLPCKQTDYSENIYWIFGLVIKNPTIVADDVMKKLKEHGIDTRHFFYPMHKQPAVLKSGVCKKENLRDDLFPNSNYISEHGFYIPSGLGITEEEQNYVIKTIKDLYGNI